jgi:hypothetical protein
VDEGEYCKVGEIKWSGETIRRSITKKDGGVVEVLIGVYMMVKILSFD